MERRLIGFETRQPAALGDDLLSRAVELVPVLRQRAARTEELRQIPPETVRDLVSSGLIRIGNPRRYGGHGVEQFGRQALGLGKNP